MAINEPLTGRRSMIGICTAVDAGNVTTTKKVNGSPMATRETMLAG